MYKFYFLMIFTLNSFACELLAGKTIFTINNKIKTSSLGFKNCEEKDKSKVYEFLSSATGNISERYLRRVTGLSNLKVTPKNINIRGLEQFATSKLTIGDDIKIKFLTEDISADFLVNKDSYLNVSCHNCSGKGIATFKFTKNKETQWLKGKVLKAKDVFVAKSDMNISFDQISNKSFVKKRLFITDDRDLVQDDINLSHYRLNKTIKRGHVISRQDLTPTTLVKYGVPVTVSIKRKNMIMTLMASPLGNGFINEYVKLKNSKSNKIFTAKVIGKNKVKIEL